MNITSQVEESYNLHQRKSSAPRPLAARSDATRAHLEAILVPTPPPRLAPALWALRLHVQLCWQVIKKARGCHWRGLAPARTASSMGECERLFRARHRNICEVRWLFGHAES